ncbi:hypothetical protein QCA50_004425 [Cerrena zonata]|uniref:DUF6589 domain-containing protein n=1 Tax=Cerrena zonata TaxID=2478898 RepID=A0AAW0GLJ0_9APHY
MPLGLDQVISILNFLHDQHSSLLDLIISILQNPALFAHHRAVEPIGSNVTALLVAICESSCCGTDAVRWMYGYVNDRYAEQVVALTNKGAGWHFSASNTRIEQVEAFNLVAMANTMQAIAPELYNLIGHLLAADERTNEIREARRLARIKKTKDHQKYRRGRARMHDESDSGESDSSDIYWEDMPGELEDVGGMSGTSAEDIEDRPTFIRERIVLIRRVTCLSIFMQSSNQQCNALQSMVGLYLHTCHVSEATLDLLARMGCSISTTSVNKAITSLSAQSSEVIERIGRTLLTSFVFDNLDADIKRLVPTAENPNSTLIHITAGMLIPLEHGITLDDLQCSDELWKKSKLNPYAIPDDLPPNPDVYKLMRIHEERERHPSGLLRRTRFNAWVILYTLVHHGPGYFRKFRRELGKPEVIEQIPLVKTRQIPVRAMDINPSTVGGNGDVLTDLFRQAGIGDPTEDGQNHVQPIGNTIILVHGDLGTGERLESLAHSRSLEGTPLRRFQMVIFVLGLFHLKMACADALWRIFIQSKASHDDLNSLFRHVGQIRPRETGKFQNDPGFRRMHEIIQHVGIASRLDFWRDKVVKLPGGYQSLQEFAESNPSWETLKKLANELAAGQVAGSNLNKLRKQPQNERDIERENLLLRQRYFLLYEEITYAMNVGDIGRVEDCFMPWVFIFRGCGKHKYASHMIKYLHNVHFVYPDGLKKAIRMNILCNPTGEAGKLRANDWLQEHDNLFTKASGQILSD